MNMVLIMEDTNMLIPKQDERVCCQSRGVIQQLFISVNSPGLFFVGQRGDPHLL